MGKAQTDKETAYITILIMQCLLSEGLLIIAMHSALLFRNHYEARKRSLTSFCLADLLVPTVKGGRGEKMEEWKTGGRGRRGFLCGFKEMKEVSLKKKEKR